MATRLLHREWGPHGILCVALEPGWVRTGLGRQEAPLSAEECVNLLIPVMAGAREEHGGRLLTHDGHIQEY